MVVNLTWYNAFLQKLPNIYERTLFSIHASLHPKWSKIFILDHDEDQNWTQLLIIIRDSKKSAKISSNNSNRQNADSLTIMNLATLPMRGLTSSVRNAVADLYSDRDPMMGEVNVEVGEILGMEGQELRLELANGGL